MEIKVKGNVRSCRAVIVSDFIEPIIRKMPRFKAGNKNDTIKISTIKLE